MSDNVTPFPGGDDQPPEREPDDPGRGDARGGPPGGFGGEDDSRNLDGCPITFLGASRGRYWYVTARGEDRSLTVREHTQSGLLGLFDNTPALDWLRKTFPNKRKGAAPDTVDYTKVQEWVMSQCGNRGFFEGAKSMRGPGVWTDADGELVIHCGDGVWRQSWPKGRGGWRDAGCNIDGMIYAARPASERPSAAAAAIDECEHLLAFLGSWNWKQDDAGEVPGPRLLFGFMCAAFFCGVIDWRPHIILLGRKETGKSTLLEFLNDEMGDNMVFTKNSSGAAIRQSLAGAARSVLFDENEPDDYGKAKEIIAVGREASSRSEAKVLRGNASQQVTEYELHAMFLLASTLHADLSAADLERYSVLALEKLDSKRTEEKVAQFLQHKDELRGIGPRLWRRLINGWDRFEANLAAYKAAGGHTRALGDQLGTLLAAGDVALSDEVTSIDAAREAFNTYQLWTHVVDEDESEASRCLAVLMSSELSVDYGEGRITRTVGELIREIVKGHAIVKNDEALRRVGVAVVSHKGRRPDSSPEFGPPAAAVRVANRHVGLSKIFRGDKYQGGVWSQAIGQLPGAARGGPTSFAGAQSRYVEVPIENVVRDDLVEELPQKKEQTGDVPL